MASNNNLNRHSKQSKILICLGAVTTVGRQEHAELEEMILQKLAISLKRGDPGRSIDLLRHDCWWPRARCLDALVEQVKAKAIPAPLKRDWPYAVNIFARTRLGHNGDLIDVPVGMIEGSQIEFIVKFDVVVAVMAAGISSPAMEIYVSPGQHSSMVAGTPRWR